MTASTSQTTSEDFHPAPPLFYSGAGAQKLPVPTAPKGPTRVPVPAIDPPITFESLNPSSTAPSFMTSDPFDTNSMRGTLHGGPVQHKLRKTKRAGAGMDGYESEGWTSDSSRKTKKELKKEKSKRKKKEQEDRAQEKREAKREKKDSTPSLHEPDAGSLSESSKKSFKRARSRSATPSSSKPPPIKPSMTPKKNSRSVSSRSLSPPSSSYPSSPQKQGKSLSFFRLNSKSSKERLDKPFEREEPEVVPPLPNRPLPIAQRFATTSSSMAGNAPSIMSTTPSVTSSASAHSHGGDDTDSKSLDGGMGVPNRVPQPWMKSSRSDPGDHSSLHSSLSISTTTTRAAVGYGQGSASSNGDMTTPVPSIRSVSPAPSSNTYVVPTPTASNQNLSEQQTFVPPGSRNPLTKLMKHMPTPLQISPNPSQLHPLYSISHPNTHAMSRTPSPLSSTSSHAFPHSPNYNPNPSPVLSPVPSPIPGSTPNKNTLQLPTTTVVRRRSLIPSPDPQSPEDDEQPDPSRAVLAYYEIPAPSPPPTGPLPRPPQTQQQLLAQPPIQRGRVSPFPSRPILPSNGRPVVDGIDGTGGFEGRVKVRRYRDLYALANGDGSAGGGGSDENGSSSGSHERFEDEDDFDSTPRRKRFIAQYPGVKDRPPSDFYEEDSVALDKVLSRYADGHVMDPSSPSSEGAGEDSDDKYYPSNEIKHSRSHPPYFHVKPPIPYPPNQDPYSTISVYSTHSIMDNEKSGEARDRFVSRVQAMYGPDGRERSSAIIDREREGLEMERIHMRRVEGGRGRLNVATPPVPKLPEEFRALHKLKEQNQRRRF